MAIALFSLLILVVASSASANTVQMTEQNFQEIVSGTELVLANFYADWCHFSRQLAPIYEEAAKSIAQEYQPHQIKLVKVDCENPQGQPLAHRFGVNKYPTMKLFRNGEIVRREYRGSRSVDAIKDYLRKEMQDPIDYAPNLMQVLKFDDKNRHIVVLMKSGEENTAAQRVMENAKKLARSLKDDCKFHAFVGTLPQTVVGDDSYKVRFISPVTESFVDFNGNAESFNDLEIWVREKCIPLVREITFENAEELTEEGVPFLILFHDPEDKHTIKVFNEEVRKQLPDQRGLVNPVFADGQKFSHPLSHLGKSAADLPVLAIDSFKHMYLFPFDVKSQLNKPGLLRQFVLDLHSGKLHREFHQGPDPTQAPQLSYDPAQEKVAQEGGQPAEATPPPFFPSGMPVHGMPLPGVPGAPVMPPEGHPPENQPQADPNLLPPVSAEEQKKQPDELIADKIKSKMSTTSESPSKPAAEEPHIPKSRAGDEDDAMADYQDYQAQVMNQGRTDPPESMFAKLAPSRLRYSMAHRDEL